MTNRRLYIVWPNGQTVTIYLENNPVADYYYDCMKHLQHVPLAFDERSNSLINTDFNALADKILELGIKLGVEIDKSKLKIQDYLNSLHDIYFQHADKKIFDPTWLKFHDKIHLIEECTGLQSRNTQLWFDYWEKAGYFVKPFDRSWLKYSVSAVSPGDCVTQQHELGKNLLLYKKSNESMESTQINQLATPWHKLRPILDIELVKKDPYQHFLDNEQEDFLQWFDPYRDSWCNHWQIQDWTPQEIFAKIPLGKVQDLTTIIENFSQGYYPEYIKR